MNTGPQQFVDPQTQVGHVPACHICGNAAENKIFSAREMMLGLRDVFQYLECEQCGCLQLLNPPADMARYYPADYTAFRDVEESQSPALTRLRVRLRNRLRKRRNLGIHRLRSSFDRLLANRFKYFQLEAFAGLRVEAQARILDVGCGSGIVLVDLRELGYENLFGVDRFIPRSIDYKNGVKVLKGGLEDLSGTQWDVIMFHHSFEHMPDPAAILATTASMLAQGGQCLIRIPVLGWAWKHYGVNWAQLDAPRHLYLHTSRSFERLADAAGLRIRSVQYDSSELQFWVSELYMRDIPLAALRHLSPAKMFSKSKLRAFRLRAAKLNQEAQGDSAVFDLVKK
jgi:2-polyprenyl-3-methyl-5-hydroxy-6-metoxy-1,4-benzoquinol methylase